MSTIRVSVLPEQSVAPPVVELIEATGIRSVEQWGFDTYNCGCALRHNDRHWVLCRYHDGMNDGLAMAAAPTPTPQHCPTCSTERGVTDGDRNEEADRLADENRALREAIDRAVSYLKLHSDANGNGLDGFDVRLVASNLATSLAAADRGVTDGEATDG